MDKRQGRRSATRRHGQCRGTAKANVVPRGRPCGCVAADERQRGEGERRLAAAEIAPHANGRGGMSMRRPRDGCSDRRPARTAARVCHRGQATGRGSRRGCGTAKEISAPCGRPRGCVASSIYLFCHCSLLSAPEMVVDANAAGDRPPVRGTSPCCHGGGGRGKAAGEARRAGERQVRRRRSRQGGRGSSTVQGGAKPWPGGQRGGEEGRTGVGQAGPSDAQQE